MTDRPTRQSTGNQSTGNQSTGKSTRTSTRKPGRKGGSGSVSRNKRVRRATDQRKERAAAANKAATTAAVQGAATKPAPVLSGSDRRHLRGLAHHLEPLVQVGHSGVTSTVVTAVSSALLDHELIKVRLYEPQDKRGMAQQLAAETRSALCGVIGHTVILYRPHPVTPKLQF